jgi:hypothetical protein
MKELSGNIVVLDSIAFCPDPGDTLSKLRIRIHTPQEKRFRDMLAEAKIIARPKAQYRVTEIQKYSNGSIFLEGISIGSRVLQEYLQRANVAFAFVATCGTELANWSTSVSGLLHQYWAETIMEMALSNARLALKRHIAENIAPKTASMQPGVVKDWPLTEQKSLFNILGDTIETVGVELTADCMMIPIKTVSGIGFPTAEHIKSCSLCSYNNCHNRKNNFCHNLFDFEHRIKYDAG